uniref:Uncharacterized protein n=1 Tax=Anguilla anguilla TaxID=7936 RepID=A0A0E9QMU7_ANGAN
MKGTLTIWQTCRSSWWSVSATSAGTSSRSHSTTTSPQPLIQRTFDWFSVMSRTPSCMTTSSSSCYSDAPP